MTWYQQKIEGFEIHRDFLWVYFTCMSCHTLLVLRFVFPFCVTGLMIWPPWETSRSGQPNLICNQCLINFPWSRFSRNTRFQCFIFTFNPELSLLRTPKEAPYGKFNNIASGRARGEHFNHASVIPSPQSLNYQPTVTTARKRPLRRREPRANVA